MFLSNMIIILIRKEEGRNSEQFNPEKMKFTRDKG